MLIKSKEMTFNERCSRIVSLIRQFREGEAFYTSKDFFESEVRSKFIDPFLECLKWDVKNEKGARPDKREVITEDRVLVEGKVKHPDYTLCYGGLKKIYVEAKQASVNLKVDPAPALQVRRYAYTAKMPIAILTDFQEFAIYDARIKPNANDDASTARIEYLTYNQYVEKFEELYNRISWDAVDLGKFDSYYEGVKDKRGTSSIDEDILKMIEAWREALAEDISLHNMEMSETSLTSSVQKIIDRVLFLRICEDKEIEPYKQLQKVIDRKNIYTALKALFANANTRFNAGLFARDDFLDSLKVEDKTLYSIIDELYYPKCQYEFSVLPVEILGNIYERFLGKVIRFKRKTKNGHSVEIVEKPEVQKAKGVYYTPSYIVDYIVENTIGKKIEGTTPEKVANLKICDPSCGSGSFLVGAYQYLLDWHFDYYFDEKRKEASEAEGVIYKDASTHEWKLSIEEKRRILLNNIYGVDIDAQAVEVTKLSLFLKLLESEGKELSGDGEVSLFKTSELEKILPLMSDNIKCGNSLIGKDYFMSFDKQIEFTLEAQKSINAFDWEEEFKSIFSNGGFDCIIGNPPYLRVQGLQENYGKEIEFYKQKYQGATERFDLYVLFIERGYNLLNKKGILSFILPHKFINSSFGVGIRQFIYDNKALNFIAHFGSEQVFSKASVYTCIIGLSHNNKKFKFAKVLPKNLSNIQFESFPIERLKNIEKWSFSSHKKTLLLDKIKTLPLKLKDITKYCSPGTVSMGDDIYMMRGHFEEEYFIGFSERLKEEIKIEKDIVKPILKGEDVKRYKKIKNNYYIIYPHHLADGKTVPYSEQEMKNMFPLTFTYLLKFKKELIKKKEKYKTNPTYWYSLHCARKITMFEVPKIITPEISLGCNMSYDDANMYHNTQGYSIILTTDYEYATLAYLAILNSKIMWFFISETATVLRGGFCRFKTKYLENFPIPKLDENSCNILTQLTKEMLATHKQLSTSKFESDKKFLEQRIEILDKKIDSIVFKLYEVNEDEVNMGFSKNLVGF